jgi:hypothetical protein
LRALKSEFSELTISLRAYTKEKTFNRTIEDISENFDSINESLRILEENLE